MVREILKEGDEVLRKKAHDVTSFDSKLHALLDDMYETMKSAGGVGLAAPQIGLLRRVVVIDTADEDEPSEKVELINPVIVKTYGSEEAVEGCLSCPGKLGVVERPLKVVVKAFDRFGKEIKIKGEGLKARAICHEVDHLNGVLFLDKVLRMEETD